MFYYIKGGGVFLPYLAPGPTGVTWALREGTLIVNVIVKKCVRYAPTFIDMIEMICIGIFYPSFSETNIKHLGQDSHLSWDDPYYDIARHQIVEVAGEFSPYLQIVLY